MSSELSFWDRLGWAKSAQPQAEPRSYSELLWQPHDWESLAFFLVVLTEWSNTHPILADRSDIFDFVRAILGESLVPHLDEIRSEELRRSFLETLVVRTEGDATIILPTPENEPNWLVIVKFLKRLKRAYEARSYVLKGLLARARITEERFERNQRPNITLGISAAYTLLYAYLDGFLWAFDPEKK